MNDNNITYAWRLASAASWKSKEMQFDMSAITVFEYNGEVYSIGPFILCDYTNIHLGCPSWVYPIRETNDEYALIILEENADSWHTMYSDFGAIFDVCKVKPIIHYASKALDTEEEKVRNNFDFPYFQEW